jgi:hypothetical protein
LAAQNTLGAGVEFYDEFISTSRRETLPDGTTQQIRPRFPNGTRYQSLGIHLADDWNALAKKLHVEGGLRFS